MINLKQIVRTVFGWVNFSTTVRLRLWWMWTRRNRTFLIFEGKEYTCGEVYTQSKRYENYFLSIRKRLVEGNKLGGTERLSLGIYMENTPEFLFASFAVGLSNSILFAINSGFRGETLAKVINQAKISKLIINSSTAAEVERALPQINVINREDILFVGDEQEAQEKGFNSIEKAISESEPNIPRRYRVPIDNFSPVLVIYTSGTTGMPKGVPCTHIKLFGAGMVVRLQTHLKKTDRGYISMPLFHSNAWYTAVMPLLLVGGSFVLKRKFSASAFEEDMLTHGVTYLNYVGQPLHYIIDALEKKYSGGESVERALAAHPKNRLRIAYGNGAPAVDRKKLIRYFGMEHIFEIYGSTEAVITTANQPGDPIECLGRVPNSVKIFDEEGRECQPGVADDTGELTNYDEAVGEIVRKVGDHSLRFEGYVDNAQANARKFRNGYYHSGDIGHIRVHQGKRYLYFNGRTDDWIRKDGENFSAENVVAYAQKLPCADLAIAYGVPSDAADEKVMISLQLKKGGMFYPDDVFAWFMKQQKEGGMDPKWMPDYIRIIEAFPLTDTQKILVRPYKRDNFNIERNPHMEIYYRMRGDSTYHRLTREKFLTIQESFIQNGRGELLRQS